MSRLPLRVTALARSAAVAAIVVMIVALQCRAAWAQKKATTVDASTLAQLVDKHFARWDHNHDGYLDLAEIDRRVEDHSVTGLQSAMIFRLRQRLTAKDAPSRLSREQVMDLTADRAFRESVESTVQKLGSIDRELFLPTDPDLLTFQQGRLGDCYLLSTTAAQVHRDAKSVRDMIHLLVTGEFEVAYGDGQKILVPRLTETELLIGAHMDGHHGCWLAVLEKSYGIIRDERRGKEGKASAPPSSPSSGVQIVPTETLNGGSSAEIISLLTGHRTATLDVEKTKLDDVHSLLLSVTKQKRLVCLGGELDGAPPGIVKKHAYALFGYDGKQRTLTIFNPWGNTFKPKGDAGLKNGYVTEHGQFVLPLDQLSKVFKHVVYETDKPLVKIAAY